MRNDSIRPEHALAPAAFGGSPCRLQRQLNTRRPAMIDVLFIGLSLGSILLLVALVLAITYGAMGVINMAHGEMVMVGAYTTVMSSIWLGTGIIIAIPLAFIVTALLGLLIERVVVRRLYGRLLDTLLATWGIAILIQQAVRLEFGLTFLGIHIEGLGPGLQNVTVLQAL